MTGAGAIGVFAEEGTFSAGVAGVYVDPGAGTPEPDTDS